MLLGLIHFLSSRKDDPGCLSWIRILIFLPIPDAGFWICNTFYYIFFYSGGIQWQDGAVLLEDPVEATAEGGHRPATVDNRP